LGFARSILKVAPVWAIKFQGKLLVREEATTPQAESARDKRNDIAPDGHARVAFPCVFDRTDAYSDIDVRNEKAPRYVLKIEAGMQVIKATDDDISFLERSDGYRFWHPYRDAATPATGSDAPDEAVHHIDLPTLEPDIKACQAHESMSVRTLDAIRVNNDYFPNTEVRELLDNVAPTPTEPDNGNPSTAQDILSWPPHNECLTLEGRVLGRGYRLV
jgi:hypothetical protein